MVDGANEDDWRPWPSDWPARKAGGGCQLCEFLSTEDPDWGVRIYTGRAANGYLSVRGQIPGYCWVIWRGDHVCEPTEVPEVSALDFFADLLAVGRAVTTLFQPAKVNYAVFGNNVPHLHGHVIPRPNLDPDPRGALAWTYLDDGRQPADRVQQSAAALEHLLS
ncbi:HIT family protein [Actinoplanes sp. NPDC026619]|uniref:HIT family protein n=1 Tax=Actinoplanes sp. NPDC026619 TaxID=3155798 RepID=UPI00340C1B7C